MEREKERGEERKNGKERGGKTKKDHMEVSDMCMN